MTTYQMRVGKQFNNMKGAARSDKPTKNFNLNLQ